MLLAADLTGAADVSFGQTGGATANISGNVYAASLAGCENHQADAALADVRVQLLDETGSVLEESLTDELGTYRFADLLPGRYAVRQITAQGFLDGASTVGTGGGIAFSANRVGEIVVQAGESLGGYDFCDLESLPEPSGPTDRPIVPHENGYAMVPILSLSLQQASSEPSIVVFEPVVESATAASFVALSPLNLPRPTEIFGGSSQALNEPEKIKAWDDYLLDGLFAKANFLDFEQDFEDGDPISEAWVFEAGASDEWETLLGETDASADERNDGPFADGYTVNSIDWLEEEPRLELDQRIGDAEIIDTDEVPAEVVAMMIGL